METDEPGKKAAEIEARERELANREAALEARSVRRNPYDRVDVPIRTMDIIIILCAATIVLLIVFGVYASKMD
ncbi:MAG: hypothetical protein LBU64_12775 [Planctomycetota bacterium]|nr:hypothetical protein [Planctomycetota bacterium]